MFKTLAVFGSVAIIGLSAVTARASVLDHTGPGRDRKEAVQMVGQVEEVARRQVHADRLQDLSRSVDVSRWSHYHHLDGIKSLVNDGLRPALSRLLCHRHAAARVEAGLDRPHDCRCEAPGRRHQLGLHRESERRWSAPAMNDDYKRFIADVASHADALVKTSDAAHSYATAHLKASEAGLRVPASRSSH